MGIQRKGLVIAVCLFGLFAVYLAELASAQVLYGHRSCNRALEAAKWRPSSWMMFSELLEGADLSKPLTIPCGMGVLMDKDMDVTLQGLHIEGLLYLAPKCGHVRIRTRFVTVSGYFRIGVGPKNALDADSDVEIVLDNQGQGMTSAYVDVSKLPIVGGDPGEEPSASGFFGDRAFAVVGGQVKFHGVTKWKTGQMHGMLLKRASPGDTDIVMDGKYSVREGETIVVAPSGYNRWELEYLTVDRRVLEGSTTRIYLKNPIKYLHYGKEDKYIVGPHEVDMAAEVVLLRRPIRIIASEEKNDVLQGGHFIVSNTAMRQIVHGTEFYNMGQQAVMGKYPIHFHMCGVTDKSQILGCSVHKSYQRGIVIHGSRGVEVSDNVLVDIAGHGILAGEDGWEQDNKFYRNVGILFHRIKPVNVLPDSSDDHCSGLWITNSDNEFIGNRLIASEKSGIWFEMRDRVFGGSMNIAGADKVVPKDMGIKVFIDNVAHSNAGNGVQLYPERWVPTSWNFLEGVFSYKNLHKGIFMHAGFQVSIRDSILVDNKEGAIKFDRQLASVLKNSLVVGRSPLGGMCPDRYGVEFHQSNLNKMNPAKCDNVIFDGFSGCPMHAVGVDGRDDRIADEMFSSATGLYNCEFVDVDSTEALSIKEAANSGLAFSPYLALAVRDTKFPDKTFSNGYAVRNSAFLRPVGSPYATMSGGVIADDVCYRSVGFVVMGNMTPGAKYAIEVKRVRNGAIERPLAFMISGGSSKWKYFMSLETDERYEVRVIIPSGAKVPSDLRIEVADGDNPCTLGSLLINIVQDKFSVSPPLKFLEAAVPYDSCLGPEPNGIAYYKDVCKGSGLQEREIVIPPGSMPFNTHRGELGMKMEAGKAKCETMELCR